MKMNKQQAIPDNPLLYYRLIALWALAEALLGGIIHGLRIPVSGLVVGSCAVICISLIAWYVPEKGSIIKATIIVAIFKMLLSPQAPFPAYIAVFFQGLMGELLFWNRRFFRLSCIALAILSLLESGFQRILILTIVYSNDLWIVINNFFNGLTKQKTATNYSLLIGGGYVLIHLVVGLLIGLWTGVLPKRIIKWQESILSLQSATGRRSALWTQTSAEPVRKKKGLRIGLFVIWIALVGLYIQSYYKIGEPLLPSHISLRILIRSFIIVLTWYFVISPLLKKILHWWLEKKISRSQPHVQKVLELLPDTQQLVANNWEASKELYPQKRGWGRLVAAGKLILANALNPDQPKQVVILTGPVQTGKTTSLVLWSEKRNDVSGIITPVIDGKRIFMNADSREAFAMEADEGDGEVLTVGRFVFSKTNFAKAVQILRTSMRRDGWLVIDEIGPMELKGEGFAAVLKEALANTNEKQKILLIVREGLVEKVKEYFKISNAVVLNTISGL
jgi:nucleoside-triphosphatase THEP1